MPMLENIWSDATRDHFRNSRVEFLKGLRSLIDDRIAHLSRTRSRRARTSPWSRPEIHFAFADARGKDTATDEQINTDETC